MNVPFQKGIESDAVRGSIDSRSIRTDAKVGRKAQSKKDSRTTLQILGFAASTFADTAMVLAVLPLLLLTGPSQSDTAYSIATPAAIVAASSLLGLFMTRRIPAVYWSIVTCLARAGLAILLYLGPDSRYVTSALISTGIALLWGMRLQEIVILSGNRSNSMLFRLGATTLPAVALIILLKSHVFMQPLLMPVSLALYAVALLLASCAAMSRPAHPTTSDTNVPVVNQKGRIPVKRHAPYAVAYEIFLSGLSNSVFVVPILLLLSDQSIGILSLRAHTAWALSGWLAGSIAALVSLSAGSRHNSSNPRNPRNPRKDHRVEQWHIIFTVLLGVLIAARFSALALPALFLTAAAAGSLSYRIDRTWRTDTTRNVSWQPALALTFLSIVATTVCLYLLPLQSALPPVHVLRNLAAVLIVPSTIAVFLFRPSRLKLLKLISYMVPLHERLDERLKHSEKNKVCLYFTRDFDIKTALLIGWRLDSGVLIVTEDGAMRSRAAGYVLKLGNALAMSREEWLGKRKTFIKQLPEDERFLVYDASAPAGPLEEQISFAPDFERGAALIHKLKDEKTIVVSNMVTAPETNLAMAGAANT